VHQDLHVDWRQLEFDFHLDGGVVPTSSDHAFIRPVLRSPSLPTHRSLPDLQQYSANTATLAVNSGVTLTVTVGITNRNSATTNTSALIQGSGTLSCATLTVGGTTTPTLANSACTATLTSTISNLSVQEI